MYSNDQDDENAESNRNAEISSIVPRIMAYDKYLESIDSLSSNQRDVFNIVYKWVKKYVKNIKPVHIFVLGSGATGKCHLVKTVSNAVSKTLLFNFKEPEKPRILYWYQQTYQQ